MGLLSLICNVFFFFTTADYNKILIRDGDGTVYVVDLNENRLAVLAFLKIIGSVLMIYWGRQGMKTFKPILKDLFLAQFQGNAIGHNGGIKRSKGIKKFQRKMIKLMVATVVIMLIGFFYLRSFLLSTAEDFIDEQYDQYDREEEENQRSQNYSPSWNNSYNWDQTLPQYFNTSNSTYPYWSNETSANYSGEHTTPSSEPIFNMRDYLNTVQSISFGNLNNFSESESNFTGKRGFKCFNSTTGKPCNNRTRRGSSKSSGSAFSMRFDNSTFNATFDLSGNMGLNFSFANESSAETFNASLELQPLLDMLNQSLSYMNSSEFNFDQPATTHH